jgi:hypothetical protein
MGLVYNTAWKLPTVPHRVGRTRTEDGQAMRGQGGIFRRGQVWWIRYHRGGQEYRESARTADREIAIRLLHSRLAELPVKGLPQPETVTFEDLAQGYLQGRIVNGVKSGHLLWSRARVANLSTVFAGMRAVDITTAGMREYAQRRLASGGRTRDRQPRLRGSQTDDDPCGSGGKANSPPSRPQTADWLLAPTAMPMARGSRRWP